MAAFTPEEREWVLDSVIASQALAGLTVPREVAARLLDECEAGPLPRIGESPRFVDGVELSYAHRYPETAGRVLWCVDCGAPCSAELLDWSQHCTDCADWWRANPPMSRADEV